eukprot:TRINITY_DN2802_c0_g1_i1.p1 TRINITY_DN2802_c0_g1~~TRINITY_DN2802_c0_g1_i1.p1  ORF type:complete len:307 (+),score=57.51 TRINITY_DN2802_c0_g1_i1:84-1004(+)
MEPTVKPTSEEKKPEEEKKMSKKALKRQKKLEDWARLKLEKKVHLPLTKSQKAKKLKMQEKKEAAAKNPPPAKPPEEEEKKPKYELTLEEYMEKSKIGQRIVIDCNFDDKMTERELKSLAQQLGYVYSTNKRSKAPANLCVTGIGPNMKKQLEKMSYDKWRINFSEEDYIGLYPKEDLVYLTADATDVLHTIDSGKVYIIGGIVDRNRYKMITYNKAVEQGIKTAKLPLDQHINLKATKVLTVNHVFSCLIKYIETQDWTKAFLETLPLRKHVAPLPETKKEDEGKPLDPTKDNQPKQHIKIELIM